MNEVERVAVESVRDYRVEQRDAGNPTYTREDAVEIVEEKPSWEELTSEWAEGTRLELAGQLRQARAAAHVGRHYGWGSMKSFAQEVGCSKSKVYSYAKVWEVYGYIFEEASELSGRLETLGISHLIASLADPNPVQMAIEAHDSDLTVHQIEDRTREKEEPKNVETIEMMSCPKCGECYPLSEAMTWTDTREGG